MAIHAINADGVRQYVSPRDPGYDEWRRGVHGSASVFSLRALSVGELAAILDSTQEIVSEQDGRRGLRIHTNRRNCELVAAALAGWHNFLDERGNPLTFELTAMPGARPRATERSLELIPAWLVRELAHQVMRHNSLSEQEAKNSVASSAEKSATSSEALQSSDRC